MTFTGEFNIGDPGSESGTITVNGVAFNAVAKINEFGGTQDAELVLHRHATSAPSNLVFSRSRGTTATHADVQDGDILGRMIFVGRHTSSYYWGASIWSEIDGTPGVSDMPCAIVFGTTADGATTPTERFRISPAGALGINGETYGTASQSIVMSGGSAAAPSWLTAGTNNQLLRQTGGALNFGQLTAGMFPNTVVPDAALSSNVPLLNVANVFTNVINTFSSASPELRLTNTSAGAGLKTWSIQAEVDGDFSVFTRNDALSAVENAMIFSRNSSSEVTTVTFFADLVTFSAEFRIGNAISALITNVASPSIYSASGSGSGDFASAGNLFIQPRTSAARDIIFLAGTTSPVERMRILGASAAVSFAAQLRAADGAAATPSYAFTNDSDTGMYRSGANQIGFSASSALILNVSTTGFALRSGLVMQMNNAAEDSAVTLANTGGAGVNRLAFTMSSTERFAVLADAILARDGTAALPGISFISDTNSGIYRIGADNFGFSTNGVLRADVSTARVNFDVPVQLQAYTVATLPAGTQGFIAYVTDALAPTFLTAIVGGGAAVTPVFYDGTNWVAI